MSKSSKLFLGLLTVCLALSLVLGLTYSVKKTEEIKDENYAYAVLLTDLKTELNYNIENVTELQKDLVLKGLELEDLQKVVTVYETKIETLTETVTEYEEIIVEKEKVITEKETEVVTLTETVTEYEERIVYLEASNEDNTAEIEALQAEINRLQDLLEAKNAEIEELKSQKNTVIEEKTIVETELVEVEKELEEAETVIEERDEEIAQLTVNVNVLNQTIIELNVKIELLEEALDKDISKEYLQIFSDYETIRFIKNEHIPDVLYYSYLPPKGNIATNVVNTGIYKLNINDYSFTKIYNKLGGYVAHVFPDGNMLFYSNDIHDAGVLYLDIATNEVTELVMDIGNAYNQRVGITNITKLTDGNVIFSNSLGLYHFDYNTKSLSFITDNMYNASDLEHSVIEDGLCLVSSRYTPRNNEYGFIIYDYYSNEIVCSSLEYYVSMTLSTVSSPEFYNVVLGESLRGFTFKGNSTCFALLNLDTCEFKIVEGQFSHLYPYIFDNRFIVGYGSTTVTAYDIVNDEIFELTSDTSVPIGKDCKYNNEIIFHYTSCPYIKIADGEFICNNLYFDMNNKIITKNLPTKKTVVNNDTVFYNVETEDYVLMSEYGELTLDKTEVYVGETITVSMQTSNYDIMGIYYSVSDDLTLDGSNFVRISLDENNSFVVTADMIVNDTIQLFLMVGNV